MATADFDIDYDNWALVKWGPDDMPCEAFIVPTQVMAHPGCVLMPEAQPPLAMFPRRTDRASEPAYVELRSLPVTPADFRGCVYPDGEEFIVLLLSKDRAIRVLTDENLSVAKPVTIGGVTFIDAGD